MLIWQFLYIFELSKYAQRVQCVEEMQKRGKDDVNRTPGSKDMDLYVSKVDYNPNPTPNLNEYAKFKLSSRAQG